LVVEGVEIAAEAGLEAQPVAEEDLLRDVAAEGALPYGDVVHHEEALAPDLALERDVDAVVAVLDPDLGLQRDVVQHPVARPAAAAPEHVALVTLVDAVAGDVVGARLNGAVAGIDDGAVRHADET